MAGSPGRFRRLYGEPPLHLLAVIATLAVAGYGFFRIYQNPDALNAAIWFGGAIVAHDLIAFPLYTALNLIAHRSIVGKRHDSGERRLVPVLNYVRVPLMLSGLAFILWFPLILGLSEDRYFAQSGESTDIFLQRWLLLSAALLVGSALLYAVRLRRALPGKDVPA